MTKCDACRILYATNVAFRNRGSARERIPSRSVALRAPVPSSDLAPRAGLCPAGSTSPAGSASYSTIRKILERLEKKQASERVGKAARSVLYRARVGHAAIVRREIRRFLELMFDGAAVPLLAHLADMKALELEDLRALEQALSTGGASEPEPNEDAE